jgi:hypothetical protein
VTLYAVINTQGTMVHHNGMYFSPEREFPHISLMLANIILGGKLRRLLPAYCDWPRQAIRLGNIVNKRSMMASLLASRNLLNLNIIYALTMAIFGSDCREKRREFCCIAFKATQGYARDLILNPDRGQAQPPFGTVERE